MIKNKFKQNIRNSIKFFFWKMQGLQPLVNQSWVIIIKLVGIWDFQNCSKIFPNFWKQFFGLGLFSILKLHSKSSITMLVLATFSLNLSLNLSSSSLSFFLGFFFLVSTWVTSSLFPIILCFLGGCNKIYLQINLNSKLLCDFMSGIQLFFMSTGIAHIINFFFFRENHKVFGEITLFAENILVDEFIERFVDNCILEFPVDHDFCLKIRSFFWSYWLLSLRFDFGIGSNINTQEFDDVNQGNIQGFGNSENVY